MTQQELIDHITTRLKKDTLILEQSFKEDLGVARHFIVDNLLPVETAMKIYESFPKQEDMRLLKSFREKKRTTKSLSKLAPLLTNIVFALQSPEVIELVKKITHFSEMSGDPHLYAGGLSLMSQGHFLNPHIDNSHDSDRKLYRRINALYYVTPNWKTENGGNLELWDETVKHSIEISSLFNRLVIMETNRTSWHSVNRILISAQRTCVSNYYFSETSFDHSHYFHITEFSGRPEEPVRRMIAKVDRIARTFVRRFVKRGVGKKDLRE